MHISISCWQMNKIILISCIELLWLIFISLQQSYNIVVCHSTSMQGGVPSQMDKYQNNRFPVYMAAIWFYMQRNWICQNMGQWILNAANTIRKYLFQQLNEVNSIWNGSIVLVGLQMLGHTLDKSELTWIYRTVNCMMQLARKNVCRIVSVACRRSKAFG